MNLYAWVPIIFVAVFIVPSVLGLDGGDPEPPFRSFRERMRWPGRRSPPGRRP
jgi:hypothetical protein